MRGLMASPGLWRAGETPFFANIIAHGSKKGTTVSQPQSGVGATKARRITSGVQVKRHFSQITSRMATGMDRRLERTGGQSPEEPLGATPIFRLELISVSASSFYRPHASEQGTCGGQERPAEARRGQERP